MLVHKCLIGRACKSINYLLYFFNLERKIMLILTHNPDQNLLSINLTWRNITFKMFVIYLEFLSWPWVFNNPILPKIYSSLSCLYLKMPVFNLFIRAIDPEPRLSSDSFSYFYLQWTQLTGLLLQIKRNLKLISRRGRPVAISYRRKWEALWVAFLSILLGTLQDVTCKRKSFALRLKGQHQVFKFLYLLKEPAAYT